MYVLLYVLPEKPDFWMFRHIQCKWTIELLSYPSCAYFSDSVDSHISHLNLCLSFLWPFRTSWVYALKEQILHIYFRTRSKGGDPTMAWGLLSCEDHLMAATFTFIAIKMVGEWFFFTWASISDSVLNVLSHRTQWNLCLSILAF